MLHSVLHVERLGLPQHAESNTAAFCVASAPFLTFQEFIKFSVVGRLLATGGGLSDPSAPPDSGATANLGHTTSAADHAPQNLPRL
jgi:hypothetical protein